MNSDVVAGKWKQMKGQAKQWWGQLTDDDITRIEGSRDKLIGALGSGTATPRRLPKPRSSDGPAVSRR